MAARVVSRRAEERALPEVQQPRPLGRHPGDAIRVGLAIAVFLIALLAVQRDRLTLFERDVFRLFNDLPLALRFGLVAVMQAGNVVAAPVAAALALVLRRSRRMAFDLLVAGTAVWFLAKAVKAAVGRPRPPGLVVDVVHHDPVAGLGFVSGHTGVAAALATAAAPYLPRRWRRLAWAVVWIVGIARMYEGAHLPLDIVGGAALGWGVGALVHVLLGAPHRAPTLAQARAALERAGLTATDVAPVPGRHLGSFPFTATVHGRRVFMKLLDPEPRNEDVLYRMARFVAFRDPRDEARLADVTQQAEHEAAMTLLARAAAVRAPAIIRVQRVGAQVWLIEEDVGDRSLARLPHIDIDDTLLRAVWEQVALLHSAALAHRDLVAANIVVDEQGNPWVVDFAHATSGPHARAFDNDIAELLVSTGAIVGASRAVAAAVTVLGSERVAAARPELQPLALTADARRTLRQHESLLADLRAEVAALDPTSEAGDDPAYGLRPHPLPLGVLLLTGAFLVAVGDPSALWGELWAGSWRWAGFVVLLSVAAVACRAAALVAASGRPLGLGRTSLACLVSEGAHVLAVDNDARDAVLRGYLVRAGVGAADAYPAIVRFRIWRFLLVTTGTAASAVAVARANTDWRWTRSVAGLLAAAAVIGLSAAWRSWRGPRPPRGRRTTWGRDATTLVLAAATAAELALTAAAGVAAVKAVGGDVSVAAVLVAVLGARLVASLLLSTVGVEELALAAGLIAAGVDATTAAAAVVVFRGAASWGPAATGALVERSLRRRLAV